MTDSNQGRTSTELADSTSVAGLCFAVVLALIVAAAVWAIV